MNTENIPTEATGGSTMIDATLDARIERQRQIHVATRICAKAIEEIDEELRPEVMKLLAPYSGSKRASRGGSRRGAARSGASAGK